MSFGDLCQCPVCIEQSKRTLKCIEDGCDKLLRTFELEKGPSYDPMGESVMLIRGDPRLHT